MKNPCCPPDDRCCAVCSGEGEHDWTVDLDWSRSGYPEARRCRRCHRRTFGYYQPANETEVRP